MENPNRFGPGDDEEREDRLPAVGGMPAGQSPRSGIDMSKIEPTGTSCRTCLIFILLVGAVAGFIYFYMTNQPPAQTPPAGPPQGNQGQGANP